jgi:RsiW-degrading membrane proteinase PrsW (M82 family)
MDTIEPQLPGGDNLARGSAPADNLQAQPSQGFSAEWSVRARRRLRVAQLIGLAIVLISACLFLRQIDFLSIGDILGMYAGLYLIPFGAGLLYLATRTLHVAPDQEYQPHLLNRPRKWFVVIWGTGVLVAILLGSRSGGDLKLFSIISLALASALTISGGVWALRWLSHKLSDEWPTGRVDAPPTLSIRWPNSWQINWAGLWGMVSTGLAIGLEALLGWLALLLLRPAFASIVVRPTATTSELLLQILRNPTFIMTAFVAIAIVAPMIEEALKPIGLRLMRGAIRRPIDGLLLGMVAGLGFGIVESTLYLGDLSGWLLSGWLRLSTLVLHGIATSIVGLAYARSRQSGRRRDLLLGYVRAVLLHGVWNTVALGLAAGLIVPEWLLVSLICGIMLIGLIWRVIPRAAMAGVQASIQEGHARLNEPLPLEWSPMDNGIGWWLMGSRPSFSERPAGSGSPHAPISPQPIIEAEYSQRIEHDLKDP